MRKRILSLLLALCMTLTLLPAGVLAAELDELNADDTADGQSGILYSDAVLTLTAESYLAEDGGSYPVTLTRGGDAAEEACFTVAVYDNSTNYGEDYRILYGGEAVQKLDGATSVYDAFRDNGTLTSGLAFELAVTEALTDDEQLEDAADVSAAAAFAQLDELGAKAAEFTVTFAAGERTALLSIEVLDDETPEYEETFLMAVLDENGEVLADAQQAFAIVDNDSPAPSVTVDFDCDSGMELTDDNDAVELTLRRGGDLATTTLVTVYVDGEIYGQVDFTPWQKVQTFDAVVGGVYTLDGSATQVEVIDSTTAELTVADGADPELDAIPDEYAVIRTPRSAELSDVSWVPAWANGTEGDNEYQKIILGSTEDNLFEEGGHSESIKGELTFYVDGKNIHEISTSGTGSGIPSGNRNMDSIDPIDLTGVESIETTVELTGLDHEAQIKFGIESHDWNVIELDRDDDAETTVHTIVATVYDSVNSKLDYRQASKHVYFSNVDPDGIMNRGTNLFVPNALKLNLRVYRFRIEGDINDMGGNNQDLIYTNSKASDEPVIPDLAYGTDVQYLTVNSKDYGKQKTVNISYSSQQLYPARLVGYKLMAKDGHCSELISLGTNAESQDTIGFTFDTDFLKKYEAEYCYREASDVKGEYWTFHIIPIYEKIKYSTLDILSATAGDIEVVQGSDYMGDRWVFGAASSSSTSQLSGVWYQAKSWKAYSIPEQGITQTRPDAGKNEFALDIEYPIYTVQGVFSENVNKLNLEYDPNRTYTNRGTVEQLGELISEDDYVVGDYVPLIARSSNSLIYQVRWHVSGSNDYYHGDVFYYQLDGNPDHNTVYLEYVPTSAYSGSSGESYEATTYGNITGTLKQAQVEARPGGNTTFVNMANTTITVRNGGQEFTTTTDANGHFTLKNFRGVAGGTYSMAILYEDAVGYTTFTYKPDEEITVELPQFGIGVPYPELVAASVDGSSTDNVALVLTDSSTISASTRVFVPSGGYEITGVKYYFVDPKIAADEGKNAPTTVIVDTAHDVAADNDDYQVWRATVTDISELVSGMQMYVEVLYKKDIYQNGSSGGDADTALSSGLVNTGYSVTAATNAESFAASYDIPSTPNMQNTAFGGSLSQITIPVLGKLDFSLSSKTGGFFVQRTDGENTILMCGSSYLASFGTGTVSDKLEQKRGTDKALAAAADKDKGGVSNAGVTALSGEPSESSVLYKADSTSKWAFNPAYLFRFTFSPKTDGSGENYLSRFEMALGVDANYIRNIPFSVYGVPFYVCLTFTTEAYFDIQAEFAESKDLSANDISEDLILDSGSNATGDDTKVASFIAAPMMNLGVKGGVGYNGFLSLYLTASIDVPFIVEVYPNVIGAFNLTGNVGFGADLILFSANVSAKIEVGTLAYNEEIGNELAELTTISPARAASSAFSAEELDELLDEVTFAPMVRSTLRQAARSTSYDGVIASGVFKNTGIHLLKLNDRTILAFYLKDNRKKDTLNYLSVAYAMSADGGDSWTELGYVSDNTEYPFTSLQYDVNLFDLGDHTLVTWSEANFDKVLENLGEVDIEALTPAQISTFMNAMDLKGRFFDENGEPMGAAFTIAENSTVACGALDAVKNGNMVYVYYQRNIFPYDETEGTVTLEQLLSTDRTIAMARASVDDTENWQSTTVRATKSGTAQEYRITDVEPFVHDGVMGEILELDRDGRLAIWDETNEVWEPSNEDRQLYLRTYTFDTDGTPIPSALMAITDPALCARSPQVVSNADYLHLFWNQDGKVVYLTDFVATTGDDADVQDCAYVVVDEDGEAMVNPTNKGRYVANDIAGDTHFHIGTSFTASMDDAGSVLLSWVATDTDSAQLTDEIYGVVLDTVTNAKALERAGSELNGSGEVYQLYANGSPVALTGDGEEKSLIGALDSVFVGSSGESSFLLAFSELDAVTREDATSADIRTAKSVYAPELAITAIDAPAYPTPGSDMTVSVTVTNRGLGEANDVAVTATGIGRGASGTIDSILPGRSRTVELTVAVPGDFDETTTMTVTADDATAEVEVRYGAHFLVKYMPEMANLIGSSDYTTVAQVYNAGNAAGVPTLNYTVSIFASDEPGKDYTCTAEESVPAGGIAYLSCVLVDTPVTYDSTGTLTVTVDVGEGELEAYQYIQGQMPKRKTFITKSDLDLDDDSGHTTVTPNPGPKPSDGDSSGSETQQPSVSFTDVPTGSWYENAVSWAVAEGITDGMGSGLFAPDLSCTRAQAVTFLWRAAGSPAPTGSEIPFTDVPADAWYRDAMLWAVEQGITKGTGDGTTFSPDLACTRAQIVTFIYRLEQAGGGGFTGAWAMQLPFTDVPDWAYEGIAWCYMKGITDGVGNGLFAPDLSCTRAQIVTLLHRYCGNG